MNKYQKKKSREIKAFQKWHDRFGRLTYKKAKRIWRFSKQFNAFSPCEDCDNSLCREPKYAIAFCPERRRLTMAELKPCPKCGAPPKLGYACGEYFVHGDDPECPYCGQNFAEMHSSEKLEIEAWNRRVEMICGNCLHRAVCGKYKATGGVNKCDHHKEEKHGRWEVKRFPILGVVEVKCPTCGWQDVDTYDAIVTYSDFNYCPNCGTPMDGGDEDG